jgi:hypothetical protein
MAPKPEAQHSTAQHRGHGGQRRKQERGTGKCRGDRRGQRRGTCTVQFDVSLKVFRSSMSCSETYYSVFTDTITTLKSAKMSYPIFKDFDKSTAGTKKENLFS